MAADPSPKPPGLEQAAQRALKSFLPALDSPQMKIAHGFAPTDDFKNLTLGEPFEPFFLDAEAIRKYGGGPVDALLTPSATWYFPVFSKGRLACIVSVLKLPEGSVAEDRLGMPEIARAWAAVREAWPEARGFTPRFVVVPSVQQFFMTVPQAEPPNLTPVPIERKESADPKTYERLKPASDAFATLR